MDDSSLRLFEACSCKPAPKGPPSSLIRHRAPKNAFLTQPRPDPQVVAKAKRRIFTAEYKLRILAEADKAKERPGALGALLRRESLYSSHLVSWRKERAAGILHALTPQKRGPKSQRNPLDEENQKLRRENQHLSEELRKAEIVIEVQKKVAMLLGRPILAPDREEKR